MNSPLTSHFFSLTSHLFSLTSHLFSLTSHLFSLTSHLFSLTSHLFSLTSQKEMRRPKGSDGASECSVVQVLTEPLVGK